MSAVWPLKLPDSEKIVLLALADFANDEGGCWPSIKTLTDKCSKSDRTIQAAIKSLVEKGHISRSEVMGKGCRYVVHPVSDAVAPKRPEKAVPVELACESNALDTPEAISPRSHFPPKPFPDTPEAASDKPSRTITSSLRATRLPNDFVVPEEWIRWATNEKSWGDPDARSEAASFCDYWQAKSGKDATKLDWRKTWQIWVRNSRRYAQTSKFQPPSNDLLREQARRYSETRT